MLERMELILVAWICTPFSALSAEGDAVLFLFLFSFSFERRFVGGSA
jgi:hypothetical protein